ncbi:tRNA methyltransferase TYW3 Ecym_7281 [Eremothecium cymbalariae DBVPG|uniref:tRNA wybutosine-synthesizing protein 3 n=1 Tax=Eremothecium cymbalariae (strain CBS 270.75 / DBVPG 7215 / KCTC 17166 / NRRL Y-17582) TaxID=931890 RepID=G8JWA7_ERECY|nr:hypothetical protein Ecym_7281 [Eremothecium cymbalariae DBVPG\
MPQDPFDQRKALVLQDIESPAPDLSPKGDIDELCLPIIHLINSHDDMVTTSSCSGRVSVFIEGNKVIKDKGIKLGGKGEGGRWLFVTHEKTEVLNWLESFEDEMDWETSSIDISKGSSLANRFVLYKFEPFILHVKCRDFDTASKLFKTAMSCGFRESGIGSNYIVALKISIKLDIPIGYLDTDKGKITMFVSKDYISLIDRICMGKFDENEKK